jgi:putative ABC transport system permease protein
MMILFASWRVSKLSVIRAIRNIPEPPPAIRTYNLLLSVGSVLVVLGFVSSLEGKTPSNATLSLIGPALSLFGFGLVLTRFLKNRYAFTVSSLALLVYWGYPLFSWNNPATPPFSSDFTPFVTAGIFMVAAGVLLLVYNINLLIQVVSAIGRPKRNWLPILRIGLSYPASKKVRTGGCTFDVCTCHVYRCCYFDDNDIGSGIVKSTGRSQLWRI